MKVTGTGKRKTEEASSHTAHSRGGAGVSSSNVSSVSSTFFEVVEDIESRQLVEELDAIGAQLSRFPTSALLSRYRELVRMVLEKVRSNTHIRREFKWRRTERSMFVTIERVEGALDEMDEALIREGDRTRLLVLMDEIKGCLISLLF